MDLVIFDFIVGMYIAHKIIKCAPWAKTYVIFCKKIGAVKKNNVTSKE